MYIILLFLAVFVIVTILFSSETMLIRGRVLPFVCNSYDNAGSVTPNIDATIAPTTLVL